MKEEMIRRQAMEASGELSLEEKRIAEVVASPSPDISIPTGFLTIFCC